MLLLFFAALVVPTVILVYQAFGQLKWEAFHQHQQLAREMAQRIDRQFNDLIEREERRSFSDYSFLNVTGSEGSPFLQRSPLSGFPIESDIPGLLGYFQVDAKNQLATPTVPQSNASGYGISSLELHERQTLEKQIRDILHQNRLVKKEDKRPVTVASSPSPVVSIEQLKSPVEGETTPEAVFESNEPQFSSLDSSLASEQGQQVFDLLKTKKKSARGGFELDSRSSRGRVDELKLEDSYAVEEKQKAKKSAEQKIRINRQPRKETAVLPESLGQLSEPVDKGAIGVSDQETEGSSLLERQQAIRIHTFETEVDPLEFSLLDSGHFVLFRRVWREGERYIQGMLLDPKIMLDRSIDTMYRASLLSSMSNLIVAYQGDVVEVYRPRAGRDYMSSTSVVENERLYQSRLAAPFADIELIFTLSRLPVGAGGKVIVWVSLIIAIVLIGGFIMLYRLAARQIALGRQQQDFVSAVSHELKTPITSIRMYGEMLREGWADESRKKSYYDFIFHESERLSRLINNILHLARMTRNDQKPDCKNLSIAAILTGLRAKLATQLESAGFQLQVECSEQVKVQVLDIDEDWLTQVFINLIDNAIKFSAAAENKTVSLECRLLQDGRIQFSVRDYGPGVNKAQMKRIFKLFYRSENELTRETVGTGIGLALVQQLVAGMSGEVDVVNCDPGVEFRIRFPAVDK